MTIPFERAPEGTYTLRVDSVTDIPLRVRRIRGREAINGLYRFEVECVTPNVTEHLEHSALGNVARLTIAHGAGARHIHGIVNDLACLGMLEHEMRAHAHYRVTLVPRMWLLTQQRNSRVFQNQSIKDIVDTILGEALVPRHWLLNEPLAERQLCIQYEETDYDFLRRILSEVGILFFFEQIAHDLPEIASQAPLQGLASFMRELAHMPRGDVVTFVDDAMGYPPAGVVADGLMTALQGSLASLASRAVSHFDAPLPDVELPFGDEPASLAYRPIADALQRPAQSVHAFASSGRVRPVRATFRDIDPSRPRAPVTATHSETGTSLRSALASLGIRVPDELASRMGAPLGAATDALGTAVGGAVGSELEELIATRMKTSRTLEFFGHHTSHLFPEHEHYQHEPRRELESRRRDTATARGESGYASMSAGHVFALHGHPLEWLNRAYVVTAVEHRGAAYDFVEGDEALEVYANTFECAPADVAWVPERHQRRTVQGCMTATVVDRGDEIHTDDPAVVKVCFHWDRRGKSQDATCWIRSMQAWAGASWGTQFIPRAGTEVVVGFDGGDIDRPIVLGSLYNAVRPPPFNLPEDKTRSGIRSRTTPNGEAGNELSFEDKAGGEQILIVARRDLDTVVEADRSLHVKRNDRAAIDGTQAISVTEEQTVTLNGGRSLAIHQHDDVQVHGSSGLTVHGTRREHVLEDAHQSVDGNCVLEVRGALRRSSRGDAVQRVTGSSTEIVGSHDRPSGRTVRVEGASTISSTAANTIVSEDEIVLRCGNSFVRLAPDRIEIGAQSIVMQTDSTRIAMDAEDLRLFASGTLQGIGEGGVAIRSTGAGLALSSEASLDGSRVLLNSPESAQDPQEREERTPTIIELVDQHGAPVPNQPYSIALDDGTTVTGVLDRDGKAQLDLETGGHVTFPGLSDVAPSG